MGSSEKIVTEMFRECTTNERINLAMFVTLMAKTLHVSELETKLINAFEALDTRKSGTIDASDFSAMLTGGGSTPFSAEEVIIVDLFPISTLN